MLRVILSTEPALGPLKQQGMNPSTFPSAAVGVTVAVTVTKQCLPLRNEQRSPRLKGTGSGGVSPRESRLLPAAATGTGEVGMAGKEEGEGRERE